MIDKNKLLVQAAVVLLLLLQLVISSGTASNGYDDDKNPALPKDRKTLLSRGGCGREHRCGTFLFFFHKTKHREVDGGFCTDRCQLLFASRRGGDNKECGSCRCTVENAAGCSDEEPTFCGSSPTDFDQDGEPDVDFPCWCTVDVEGNPFCMDGDLTCRPSCKASTDCLDAERCVDLGDPTWCPCDEENLPDPYLVCAPPCPYVDHDFELDDFPF